MSQAPLFAECLVVEPFAENSWVVGCRASGRAVLVDPGGRVDELVQLAGANGLQLDGIWLTHAHLDHVTGVADALERLGEVPLLLHPDDRALYEAVDEQARMFGLQIEPPPPPTGWFEAPGRLRLGQLDVEVLHVPGHSPGHVAFWVPAARTVIQGDVLFAGSIGRTDLPGGDHATLMRSIEDVLIPLGDDVRVLCGHGPDTTIGRERAANPFLRRGF